MRKILCIVCASLFFATVVSAKEMTVSKWFMAQTDKAEVKSVVATSELVEAQFGGKYLYPPINILDGNFDNTWCEADKNGSGIGESITVEFTEPVSFDEIQIVNGFASKDYYKKNNRVKSIVLTQVAKEHFQQKEYTLKDNTADWQSIKFALSQTAQTITIKITDIYKGDKYDDTCLDDIRLLYKGKVIPFIGVEQLKKVQEENSKQMLKSSAADFKKQFFDLFEGDDKIYLMNNKSADDSLIIYRHNDQIKDINDSYLSVYKSPSSKEKFRELLKNNCEYFDWNSDVENYNPEKTPYVAVGNEYRGWRRPEWSLGNFRILKTEMIDYVETTTAIIVKIDGKTIYLNGVPYSVIPGKQVTDYRFYDGP